MTFGEAKVARMLLFPGRQSTNSSRMKSVEAEGSDIYPHVSVSSLIYLFSACKYDESARCAAEELAGNYGATRGTTNSRTRQIASVVAAYRPKCRFNLISINWKTEIIGSSTETHTCWFHPILGKFHSFNCIFKENSAIISATELDCGKAQHTRTLIIASQKKKS